MRSKTSGVLFYVPLPIFMVLYTETSRKTFITSTKTICLVFFSSILQKWFVLGNRSKKNRRKKMRILNALYYYTSVSFLRVCYDDVYRLVNENVIIGRCYFLLCLVILSFTRTFLFTMQRKELSDRWQYHRMIIHDDSFILFCFIKKRQIFFCFKINNKKQQSFFF